MARKKPVSGKARKAQLQTKRATKKANFVPTPFPADQHVEAPSRPAPSSRSPASTREDRIGQRFRTPEQRERDAVHAGRMALESRFIRLSKEDAESVRQRAASRDLPRPVPPELGVLCDEDLGHGGAASGLSCPKRPKWTFNQTKKEVERNEEGVFKKWLAQTDEVLAEVATSGGQSSPTFFERNLNVWRQLWRTTEQSDILLVLVDVRFPLLHYPPSLRDYLRTLRPPRPVIIVLTKTDLVPQTHAEAWKAALEQQEGPHGARVVLMESYRAVEAREETQGSSPRYAPAAPPAARVALVDALRAAHAALLTPPPIVASDPARLARWTPAVRKVVDWDSVTAEGGATGAHAGLAERSKTSNGKRRAIGKGKGADRDLDDRPPAENAPPARPEDAVEHEDAHPFLTIGLIGQPNVGKSSLLNALLGKKIVRASRTPGKTKTLQTIYLNHAIRLADCPGLVCPSIAGFERQVLGGILPIQNVESVMHFVGERLPVEKALRLRHPAGDAFLPSSEFTLDEPEAQGHWTTDDILVAYALQQNFVTAKVGRPDIYRAGSSILRLLHASTIPWGFRPHLSNFDEQDGIAFTAFSARAAASTAKHGKAAGLDSSEDGEDSSEASALYDLSGTDSDSADEKAVRAVRSAFAALAVEGGSSDSEDGASASEGSGSRDGAGSEAESGSSER
ncbi:hypothetical protein JCM10207_008890 [Rhodosporidiobolus poonsookiae]